MNFEVPGAFSRKPAMTTQPHDPRDIRLTDVDLPMRAWNALWRHGAKTLGDVADMSLADIWLIERVGQSTVTAIQCALAQHGLQLKQPPQEATPEKSPAQSRSKYQMSDYVIIRARYETGEAVRSLGLEYGVSRMTIYKYIRLAGGNLRTAPEGRIASRAHKTQRASLSPIKLRSAREAANMSRAALAKLIGCPKEDLIRQWEKGERTVSGDYLLRILIGLKLNPRDIATTEEPE